MEKTVAVDQFSRFAAVGKHPIVATVSRFAPEVSADQKVYTFKLSDLSVARDGNRVMTTGWDFSNFKRNAVCLLNHNTDGLPVGKWINLRTIGDDLLADLEFTPQGLNGEADTVRGLVDAGFLNAVSVSWLPREWKYSTDKSRSGGIDFLKQELLEVSIVTVPALPTALAQRSLTQFDTRRSANMRGTARKFAIVGGRAAASCGGFDFLGELLQSIARAQEGTTDTRLMRAPTGAGEVDPTGGGFTVPDVYSTDLIDSVYEQAVIAPLCDTRETSGPLAGVKVPGIDETSRADGSRAGGLVSYWAAEGFQVSASKPRFKLLDFTPRKLIVTCYVTNELLNDVPMLDAHIREAFGIEGAFKIDAALLSGTGNGIPLGILNSPALITVPKETGQATATVISENIAKMWARIPGPCRKRAVWLINEDAETQLELIATAAGTAMYMPRGANGNEYPLLKGRPVHTIEQASVLGTVGDIVLADLSQYMIVSGPPTFQMSAEFHFDDDQSVFRFTIRLDGRGKYASPITPYNGSSTRSPFVTLATR